MVVKRVYDTEFRKYGCVLEGYDFSELSKAMEETDCPNDATIYVPGDERLEALDIFQCLQDSVYGGLPVQIGYCNGYNKKLNALEYHRSSEINLAVGNSLILLLGKREDISEDQTYDTGKLEAFLLPAGTAVEIFADTLHYAPITPAGKEGFRCVVVLPKGTNTDLEVVPDYSREDRLMTAKNKWLIAHPDAGIENAFVGLAGTNITWDT